jgi:hypothetical protein
MSNFVARTRCGREIEGSTWELLSAAISKYQQLNIDDLDSPLEVTEALDADEVPVDAMLIDKLNRDICDWFEEDKEESGYMAEHIAEISSPYWMGRI